MAYVTRWQPKVFVLFLISNVRCGGALPEYFPVINLKGDYYDPSTNSVVPKEDR